MAETDVTLSVNLDTADAEQSAEKLHQKIKDIFSTRGESGQLDLYGALSPQMREVSTAINEVKQQIASIGAVKPDTTEYTKYIDDLKTSVSQLVELEKTHAMQVNAAAMGRGSKNAAMPSVVPAAQEEVQKINELNSQYAEMETELKRFEATYAAVWEDLKNNYSLGFISEQFKDDIEIPFAQVIEEVTKHANDNLTVAEQEQVVAALDTMKQAILDFKFSITKDGEETTTSLSEMRDKITQLKESLAELLKTRQEAMEGKILVPTQEYLTIQAQIEKLNTELEKLQEKSNWFEENGQQIPQALGTKIEYTSDEINRLIAKLRELEQSGQAFTLGIQTGAQEANLQLGDLYRTMTSLRMTMTGIARFVPNTSARLTSAIFRVIMGATRLVNLTKKQLIGAVKQLGQVVMRLFSIIVAHPIIAAITAVAAALIALHQHFKKIAKEMMEIMEAIGEKAKDVAKKVLEYAGKGLLALIKGFRNVGLLTPRLFARGLAVIIDRMKSLRSIISENIKEMAAWNFGNNQVNKSLSNILTSVDYLKSVLATVVAPIITMLEPIITTIADRLADFMNGISMVVAKLSGAKTWQKAIKQQKDYAQALKETNKQLSTLDSLNVLNSGTRAQFELVDLEDQEFPEWLQNVSKLADHLIEVIAKGFISIPWKDIKNGAKEAASGIAEFINTITGKNGLGDMLGHTLGEGVNTLTGFVTQFLKDFDAKKVGEQIWEALETAVKTINWETLGDMFSEGVDKLIEMLYGFFDRFNPQVLADAVTTFFRTALSTNGEEGHGIDWRRIHQFVGLCVQKIVDFFNHFITPENMELIGTTLSNVLSTVVTGAKTFVDSIRWKEWADAFVAGINKFFEDADGEGGWLKLTFEALNSLATGILDFLLEAVTRMNELNLFDKVADAIVDGLAGMSWDEFAVKAVEISKAIREGLKKVWEALKNSEVWDDFIQILLDIHTEREAWDKQLEQMKKEAENAAKKAATSNWWQDFWRDILKSVGIAGQAGTTLAPHYANGQVIPPSMSEHLAVLGDNKHETEVVSPLSTMQEAMLRALQQAGGVGGNQEIVLNLDGREFMRAMVKQNGEYKKQHNGASAFA